MFEQRGESGLYLPTPGIQVARVMPGTLGEESYTEKVLSYSPIAYWPLNETSGTTGDNAEGTAARDGTFQRDVSTMGTSTGIGDGNTAPDFDGANDFLDVYSSSLDTAFDDGHGTVAVWCKVSGSGIWTDGNYHTALCLAANVNTNVVYLRKTTVNNELSFNYEAGNTQKKVDLGSQSTTGWFHMAITWDVTADEVKAYIDGSQTGGTLASLGVWSGALISSACRVGDLNGTQLWDGYLAHCAVWDSALTSANISDIATV